jgi:diadenylate cyclase
MRLLHRVSRLPSTTAIAVADHFGGLAKLQRATVDDLMTVDGVDEPTARAIRDTLSRVTESTILDQYS